jgi:hypothetical protein
MVAALGNIAAVVTMGGFGPQGVVEAADRSGALIHHSAGHHDGLLDASHHSVSAAA